MAIIVLGAGLVGKYIANELVKKDHTICIGQEPRPKALDGNVEYVQLKLGAENIASATSEASLVVNALPGHLGYDCLKDLIQLGKDVVDISFMPENVNTLAGLIVENGCKVIADFGVAPGMCGAIVGHEATKKDLVEAHIMVGGLPVNAQPPHFYKAPFSPIDVIEEYTRPARIRVGGDTIAVNPFDEAPSLEIFKVPGSNMQSHWDIELAAFYTDGLRTLLTSFPKIPQMSESTLRYTDHYTFMKKLNDAGFFAPKNRAATAQVLLPQWQLTAEDKDFTVMRVLTSDGQTQTVWELYDEYTDGISSMARTTGYAAVAAACLILDEDIKTPGLYLPETIGANDDWFKKILEIQETYGVQYVQTNK